MAYKIAVIGGSIAGLTATLVLASAVNKDLQFEITVIDAGKADLNNAEVYNVPLIPQGSSGANIIEATKKQIATFLQPHYISGKVTQISGQKGSFEVTGEDISVNADYIILATGATSFDIAGLGDIVKPHPLMNKPGKVMLQNHGRNQVKEGIYVAGLASGVTTMVSCAMGSATEAACAILSDIKGEVAIVHDSKGTRTK